MAYPSPMSHGADGGQNGTSTRADMPSASPDISLNSTEDLLHVPVHQSLAVTLDDSSSTNATTAGAIPVKSEVTRTDARHSHSGSAPISRQSSRSPSLGSHKSFTESHSPPGSHSPSPAQQYSPALSSPRVPGSPHSRTSSTLSRRKPVPEYLPMPNVSLPASHPFAGPSAFKASFVSDASPGTPNEETLFFAPPQAGNAASAAHAAPAPPAPRTGGPPPPLRKTGPASTSSRSLASSMASGATSGGHQRAGSTETVVQLRDFLATAPGSSTLDVSRSVPMSPQGSARGPPPRTSSLSSNMNKMGLQEDSGSTPPVPVRSPQRGLTGLGISSSPLSAKQGLTGTPVAEQSRQTSSDSTAGQETSSDESRSAPQTPPPTHQDGRPAIWSGEADAPGSSSGTTTPGKPLPVLAPPVDARRGSEPPKEEAAGSKADEAFSVDRLPTKRKLWEAGTLFVRDENGDAVAFGELFPRRSAAADPAGPTPKTVVFFIRTFWCGQCQDYMFASISQLDPEELKKNNVNVVIISNGSWKIIKAYRELFKCPFPIYVDASRKLYHLLGMTKKFSTFGPMKNRAAYNQDAFPIQVARGIRRGLTKMPIANYGNINQLGGEFVLAPGYECEFAHRMTNRSNHMEAPDVLRIAGVAAPTKAEMVDMHFAEEQQLELDRLQHEMDEWKQTRQSEIERIRQRKAARRGLLYSAGSNQSRLALGLEDEVAASDGRTGSHTDDTSSYAGQSEFDLHDFLGVKMEGESMYEYERDSPAIEHDEADELEMDRRFEEAMRIEELREDGIAAPLAPHHSPAVKSTTNGIMA